MLYQEPTKLFDLKDQFYEIINPPDNLTVSEWANAERVLPPGSPEPGPWKSERTPYFILPADCFDDPKYAEIVISCGSQMGKTEMILNIVGKRFDYGPRVPGLMVFPSEKLTRSMSNDRIEKMFKTAAGLWKKLDKGQKDKVVEKFIAGIRLGMGWAGSATELASHPVGLGLCDEVDRYAMNTSGEGDPITLVRARLKNYFNSKLGCFSTPTTWPGSKVTMLFYTGTMGKWSWCCPGCKCWIIPEFKILKWPEKAKIAEIEKTAFVECPDCGFHIEDIHKHKLNAQGRYEYHIHSDPDADEIELIRVGPEPPENRIASFWVSGLASPWMTFGEIAGEMAKALRSKDQETIKATLNTFCGECYKQKGTGHRWDALRGLIGEYEPGTLPERVQRITLGADVQALGIYYVIRGWGFNLESWKLESGFLPGETEYDAVWNLFSRIIDRDFDGMKIHRAFIDSGFNTNQVYKFSRRFPGLVFPCKGKDFQARPLIMSKVDLSIGGKIMKGGIRLYHVDTDYFKTWLFSRFSWPTGEPGAFHLDSATTDDYLKQITAEQMIINDKGVRSWECIRAENHMLDTEVYAVAAANSILAHKLKEYDDRTEKVQKKKKKPKKSFVNAPSGFIKRR